MRALPALVLLAACPATAHAASFEFVPAPQVDLNRVYRVDKVTGEVTSCQYGLRETAPGVQGSNIGQTLCFGSGEGAGVQPPSEYGLVASRHTREAGVFRVNYRTGEMSICYVAVKEEVVVCTQQASAPTGEAPATAPAASPARPVPSATPAQGAR